MYNKQYPWPNRVTETAKNIGKCFIRCGRGVSNTCCFNTEIQCNCGNNRGECHSGHSLGCGCSCQPIDTDNTDNIPQNCCFIRLCGNTTSNPHATPISLDRNHKYLTQVSNSSTPFYELAFLYYNPQNDEYFRLDKNTNLLVVTKPSDARKRRQKLKINQNTNPNNALKFPMTKSSSSHSKDSFGSSKDQDDKIDGLDHSIKKYSSFEEQNFPKAPPGVHFVRTDSHFIHNDSLKDDFIVNNDYNFHNKSNNNQTRNNLNSNKDDDDYDNHYLNSYIEIEANNRNSSYNRSLPPAIINTTTPPVLFPGQNLFFYNLILDMFYRWDTDDLEYVLIGREIHSSDLGEFFFNCLGGVFNIF